MSELFFSKISGFALRAIFLKKWLKIFLAFSEKMAYRGKNANFRKNNQDIFFVKNLILYKKGIFIFFSKIIRN